MVEGAGSSDALALACVEALYASAVDFPLESDHLAAVERVERKLRGEATSGTAGALEQRYPRAGHVRGKLLERLGKVHRDFAREARDPVRDAIADELGEGYQTSPDVAYPKIQVLNLSDRPVTDLSSVSPLTNLRELVLSGCTYLTDISPLAELTRLRSLNLADTGVTDIASLAKVTTLEELDLSGTGIRDVSSLAALTNLKLLDLSRAALLPTRRARALKKRLPRSHIIGPDGGAVDV